MTKKTKIKDDIYLAQQLIRTINLELKVTEIYDFFFCDIVYLYLFFFDIYQKPNLTVDSRTKLFLITLWMENGQAPMLMKLYQIAK